MEDVLSLPIDGDTVSAALATHFDTAWLTAPLNPRTCPSEHVFAATYQLWVRGASTAPGDPALHTTFQLPFLGRRLLVRLRITSHPLRIAEGRNEGSGVRNAAEGQRLGPRGIPREERLCRLCASRQAPPAVEDLLHFLVECPCLAPVRTAWPQVFGGATQPHHVLNHHDQHTLLAAVLAMLRLRASILSS